MNKKEILTIMTRKLRGYIRYSDISSVVNVFMDEVEEDLKVNKPVVFPNFGTLMFKITEPRMYHNKKERRMMLSRRYAKLHLYLPENLNNYLKYGAK